MHVKMFSGVRGSKCYNTLPILITSALVTAVQCEMYWTPDGVAYCASKLLRYQLFSNPARHISVNLSRHNTIRLHLQVTVASCLELR
jgi:hypothetical protein